MSPWMELCVIIKKERKQLSSQSVNEVQWVGWDLRWEGNGKVEKVSFEFRVEKRKN